MIQEKTILPTLVDDRAKWEQRRYEIAKEVLPEFLREAFIARNYGTIDLELTEIVSHAVAADDELVKQLKTKPHS